MLESLADLVTAVDHVGIAVADLDEAIRTHREVWGMTLLHTEENHAQGVREAILVPAAAVRSADQGVSEEGPVHIGPESTRLQLLAPLGEDSTIAKFLDRHGPGLQQLAYRVTDVDEASRRLRARGMRLLFETTQAGTGGARINFVHPKDAGGVLVELFEPVEEPSRPIGSVG